jgi:N-acetyl-1-D-myo-inositol-2-amino-2-deoxy-alpha-D-glucopyranoside deacetylase
MMGTEPNNRPDVFWNANFDEATNHLVRVIEEIKPHVMITYDEFGGYGHPDHIQAHRVAMSAAEKSSWNIEKIYWNVMPKSVIQEGIDAMKEIGSDFFGAEKAEDLPFAKDDSFVHAMVDGNAYVEQKMAAMRAHATQIEVDGPFFALSNNLGLQVWGNEYYTLVKGDKHEPLDAKGYESDLFAGIELS